MSNFVVNAIGIVNSQHQSTNIFIHIIAFYPKDMTKHSDLERFKEIKDNIRVLKSKLDIPQTELNK